MVRQELLDILVCPETKQKLRPILAEKIDYINQEIAASRLFKHSGEKVSDKIAGGLLREDGLRLYPIREDIPIMLVEEAICSDGLEL